MENAIFQPGDWNKSGLRPDKNGTAEWTWCRDGYINTHLLIEALSLRTIREFGIIVCWKELGLTEIAMDTMLPSTGDPYQEIF